MKNEAPGFLSKNMEMIAYHDLDKKPGFKMAVREIGGRWLVPVYCPFLAPWLDNSRYHASFNS